MLACIYIKFAQFDRHVWNFKWLLQYYKLSAKPQGAMQALQMLAIYRLNSWRKARDEKAEAGVSIFCRH